MATFKAGDVVVLKSGSPSMTVVEIGTTDGWPKCVYFVNAEAKYFTSAPETLTAYEGPPELGGVVVVKK